MPCQTNRIEMPAKKSTAAKNTVVNTYESVFSVASFAFLKCWSPSFSRRSAFSRLARWYCGYRNGLDSAFGLFSESSASQTTSLYSAWPS